jgi:hypothetical protein
MSAMDTRESMIAEEARRDFRIAKAESGRAMRAGGGFGAVHDAYDAMAKTWHRWEAAAGAAGLDPFTEAPDWRISAPPACIFYRVPPVPDGLTFADLHADGWRSVEHETVPDGVRNALLGLLDWDEDHSGGVFVRHRDSGAPRFAFVTWVADGRGDVRQEIAMQVPICTHDVPLADGCSVCAAGVLR